MLKSIRYPHLPLPLLIGVLLSCGGGIQSDKGGQKESAALQTAAVTPRAVDPATAVTITGKVLFQGTPPAMKEIKMAADPYCAQVHTTPVKEQRVEVNGDGTLRWVFLYVKKGLEGVSYPKPTSPVVLDQKECRYEPHVFGIQVGQGLEILNSDPTLHNIHTLPQRNVPFNLGQPIKGMKYTRSFEAPEVMIPIKCDVHSWMRSYAGVVEHPVHAVTGTDGAFTLSPLPPGDYVVAAWHEEYGTQEQAVTLGPRETKEITFTFPGPTVTQ